MSEQVEAEVPVFFHIPRCAGTYIYENVLCSGLLGQHREEIKVLLKERKSVKYSKFCRFDLSFDNPLQFPGEISCLASLDLSKMSLPAFESAVSVDHLKEYLRKDWLKLRGFVINPIVGDFKQKFSLVEDLCQMSAGKPHYFTVLRKSFDWHRSMFYYLRDVGVWEPTYGCYTGMSFVEYINSKHMADSWVIRVLTGLSDDVPITDMQYEETVKILSTFTIGFFDNMQDFLEVLNKRFRWQSKSDFKNNRNESKASEKLSVGDIPESALKIFNERVKYEMKLYEHFRNANKSPLNKF